MYCIKFCMKLLAVISPDNYYMQFYRPSWYNNRLLHLLDNSSLFQIELMSLLVSDYNTSFPARIISW
jgi:hypothetical protein